MKGRVSRKPETSTAAIGISHDSSTSNRVRMPRTMDGRTSVIWMANENAKQMTGITNQAWPSNFFRKLSLISRNNCPPSHSTSHRPSTNSRENSSWMPSFQAISKYVG